MESTAKDRLCYARKYAHLVGGSLSDLVAMRGTKRQHVLKALGCLAKFLGVYEEFRGRMKGHGLKWAGESADATVIRRLTRTTDPEEIFGWIREVKGKAPKLGIFLDFLTATGLRYSEAVESYNLIIKLMRENRLGSYYNFEKQVLEHYKFREIFIRKSKKAFISFVPSELIERVGRDEPLGWNRTKKLAWNRTGRLRFSDMRELHASLLTRYLSPAEIDFLHGRVSASVFQRHYFNPSLIRDLTKRALKAENEILTKIN